MASINRLICRCINHRWGGWQETSKTCLEVRKCKRCGDSEKRENHDWVFESTSDEYESSRSYTYETDVGTPPTSMSVSYSVTETYRCSKCMRRNQRGVAPI